MTRIEPTRSSIARLVLVLLTALLAGIVTTRPDLARVSARHHPQASAVRHDVLVAIGRTEPSMVANPRHPGNLVAGSNPNYHERNRAGLANGFFYSFDGGNSWHGSDMPVRSPWTTEADPALAVDARGSVYFAFLGEAPATYCSQGTTAVLLSRSTDGGRHFSVPEVVDGGAGLHDRPAIAVESRPNHRDRVFITWTRPRVHGSEIFFQRSRDGGRRFSRPRLLAQSYSAVFGAAPAASPGRLTVVWTTFHLVAPSTPVKERILTRTSFNDGRTWRPRTSPSRGYFKGLPILLSPGGLRVLPSPSAVVAQTGRIFVAWARLRHVGPHGHDSSDIVVAKSRRGKHWSRAFVVNDSHARDRFMPTLSSLPHHRLGVAFYDRRRGYGELDVYGTRLNVSRNRIRAGRNIRLTSGTAPVDMIAYVPSGSCLAKGRFFGDYISSVGDRRGYFHVMWADTQRHVPNVTDLWTTRLKLH